MKKIKGTLKKWWWAIAGGLLALFLIILKVVSGGKSESEDTSIDKMIKTTEDEIDRKNLQIKSDYLKKKAKTDQQKEALDKIIDEPKKEDRRKKMSKWLESNL